MGGWIGHLSYLFFSNRFLLFPREPSSIDSRPVLQSTASLPGQLSPMLLQKTGRDQMGERLQSYAHNNLRIL